MLVTVRATAGCIGFSGDFVSPNTDQHALRGIFIQSNSAGGINVTAANGRNMVRFHDQTGFSSKPGEVPAEDIILNFSSYFLKLCRRYPDQQVLIDLDSFVAELTMPAHTKAPPVISKVSVIEATFPDLHWINAIALTTSISLPLTAFNTSHLSKFFGPIAWSYTKFTRQKSDTCGLVLRSNSTSAPAFVGPYQVAQSSVSWFGLVMPIAQPEESPILLKVPPELLPQQQAMPPHMHAPTEDLRTDYMHRELSIP